MCCWASSIYWSSLRPSTGHNTHAILFDAGSSGTRMEIYKFLASGPSLRPSDVLQIDASPNKVKPGISDFSDDPTQVEAYMNPLLESAKQTIPEDIQVSTPIYSTSYGSLEMEGASHQNSRGSDKVALLLLFLTWLRKNKGVFQLDIVIWATE